MNAIMNEEKDYSNEKVNFGIWKELLRYALKSPKLIIGLTLTMLVTSVVDVIYPLLTRHAIDFYISGSRPGLLYFALKYVLIVLIQGASVFFFVDRAGKLETEIAYHIRGDLFRKLQTLSFSFYDVTPSGYLTARMISDVSRLSDMLAWSLVDLLWALLYSVGCVIAVFSLNVRLSLVILSVIPPLVVVSIYLQKKILFNQRAARKQNSKITGAISEGISGSVTTKTLVLEDYFSDSFQNLTAEMKRVSSRSIKMSALFFPLIISLGAIGTAYILSAGGSAVISGTESWFGAISIGTLVSFISYASQMFDPIQQIAGVFAEMQSAQASAERVLDLIHTESEVVDSAETEKKYGDLFHGKKENWEPIVGDIEFKNVSFSYSSGEKVLSDFNLAVRAGETVALVGETGAGKSTIVNLVCRFYEPTSGNIFIDGKDYRERSQLWLQSNLGYVLQTPHLFSGTIYENIAFGKPNATEEEIITAAKTVHADTFIDSLPDRYQTDVGEGGSLLSVGQKQLISFARVILANPRIFILDEATSSIDTETEILIQEAISNVLKNRTSFIIAHRLSTIRNADRILVIHNGKIIESGTHQHLLELKGEYYKLYMHQFHEDETLHSLSE